MSAGTTKTASDAGTRPLGDDGRMERSSSATRAHILAAAAELAKEKGAAHISIEAIAQRAGLSKGGLLYHFPKKDALIHALVEQHMAEVDAELAKVESAHGGRRSNAVARAFIAFNREKACAPQDKFDGILLALAENPHLLDPMRKHEMRVVERIRRTAADRDLSLMAVLVMHGMRALALFGVDDLTVDERTAVIERVLDLLGDDRGDDADNDTA